MMVVRVSQPVWTESSLPVADITIVYKSSWLGANESFCLIRLSILAQIKIELEKNNTQHYKLRISSLGLQQVYHLTQSAQKWINSLP